VEEAGIGAEAAEAGEVFLVVETVQTDKAEIMIMPALLEEEGEGHHTEVMALVAEELLRLIEPILYTGTEMQEELALLRLHLINKQLKTLLRLDQL
jgi:hypothetical protein